MRFVLKTLLLPLLLIIAFPAFSQRSFFGLGMSWQFMFHGTTDLNYVIPDEFSYNAYLVDKDQTSFVFQLPSFNLTMGLEYRRLQMLFEPGLNVMNFPLKMHYPISESEVKNDKETYHTQFLTVTLPLTVSYNIYRTYRTKTRVFLLGGAEYQYNLTKENMYQVYYQKNFIYALGGASVQFQGMYKPNVSLRYHYLLNVNNKADMSVSYVSVHMGFFLPTDKMKKHVIYTEE